MEFPPLHKVRDHRLETRPLVARRHYIETGNLPHFRVDFSAPGDLAAALRHEDGADGRVLVALCESAADREDASQFARSADLKGRCDVFVAVPQREEQIADILALCPEVAGDALRLTVLVSESKYIVAQELAAKRKEPQ